MNPRLLIPALLLGAVALACGSRSHSEASAKPPEPTVHHAKVRSESDAPIRSAFRVSAQPRSLEFALDVTNETRKHLELAFPSGQEYDFRLLDSTGTEVYRWSKGRMFTQSLQNRVIDGGETMRIAERLDQTLPPGTYVAVATLRSSNHPLEERVQFALR